MKLITNFISAFDQRLIKPLLITSCLLCSFYGYSQQSVSINNSGAPADSSAMLDISSSSKGLLIPRVSLTSINDVSTIPNPAISLLVYNTNAAMTDGAVGFWYFNGSVWVQVTTSPVPGTFGQTQRNDGTSWVANSTLYNNGVNIGIGTTSPTALLNINGTGTGDGNVLFTGMYKSAGPGSAPASGAGTRMMWYPDKAAFRVGYVSGTYWDTDSIGAYSIAMGYNNKAKGTNSASWGTNTTASGSNSTTMGTNTTASGSTSAAMGYITNASGFCSISMGEYSASSGNASIATGGWTNASGNFSTAMGIYNTAPSFGETVIGSYNTAYTPSGIDSWVAGDRLFVIGNGTDTGPLQRSNAMTVLKNGNTGIGTDTPAALLHIYGIGTGGGNVLFTGQYKLTGPGPAPAIGAGTRMMWYPDKSAFRAGYIDGTQWDTDSIGNYSVALGYNTKAKGYYSTALGSNANASGSGSFATGYYTKASGMNSSALGWRTEATGQYSTALGFFAVASGYISTAIGDYANASGGASTAMGTFTNAEGNYSTAMGYYTIAPSYREMAIGSYNTTYTPLGGATSWNAFDRIFSVGNGASSGNESNALTILKNGFTGLGTSTPAYQLQLSLNSAAKPTSNTWTVPSDARLKTNVSDYTEGLSTLLKIHPVWFTYTGEAGMPKETGVGVLAQELQKIAPYMVGTWAYRTDDGRSKDYLSVDNGAMTYMLINAVKEQQGIIEELKTQNSSMQKQIDELKKMLDK